LIYFILAIGILVAFQNCAKYSFRNLTSELTLKSSGNGGGYDGKLAGTYFHFIPHFTCEGRESFKDMIEVHDGRFFLFENQPEACAKVSRELKSEEIILSSLQNDLFLFADHIFMREASDLTQIPKSIPELLCRDNYSQPQFEVAAFYDVDKNTSILKIFSSASSSSTYSDSNRILSWPQISYSSASANLNFNVDLDSSSLAKPGQIKGKVASSLEIYKLTSENLTCALGGGLEPRIKFVGNSELSTPVNLRIVNELMGSWTFRGECDPLQGSVSLQGEALDTPVLVPCTNQGTFSQTVNYDSPSPHFTTAYYTQFGLPQVIARQGVHSSMTRIYKIPSISNIVYVDSAASLKSITTTNFAADHNRVFIFTEDIDLATIKSTDNFIRIAKGGSFTDYFSSSIYGDGHTIKNLNMTSDNSSYTSFLGYLSQGVVTDLHFENAKIQSNQSSVGILAGYMRTATAYRISASGSVSSPGGMYVGGLVGYGWDMELYQSWFSGSVQGGNYVGGTVGQLWDVVVKDSWSSGSVTANNSIGGAGGIVGQLEVATEGAHIDRCYSTASISADNNVGGLIGLTYYAGITSNSKDSFAAGDVRLTKAVPTGSEFAGPAVGMNGLLNLGTYSPNNIALTNLFSLDSAPCSGCNPISQAYSSQKSWAELNSFVESTWDFVEVWKKSNDPSALPPTLRYNP
jgi:hypothetical protein